MSDGPIIHPHHVPAVFINMELLLIKANTHLSIIQLVITFLLEIPEESQGNKG